VLFRQAPPRAWFRIPFGLVFALLGSLALAAGWRGLAERFGVPAVGVAPPPGDGRP
jgi:hypothetical protein